MDKLDAVAQAFNSVYFSVFQGGYSTPKDVARELIDWLRYFSCDTFLSPLTGHPAKPRLDCSLTTMAGVSFNFGYRIPCLFQRSNEHNGAFIKRCLKELQPLTDGKRDKVALPISLFYDAFGAREDAVKMPAMFAGCSVVVQKSHVVQKSQPFGEVSQFEAFCNAMRGRR